MKQACAAVVLVLTPIIAFAQGTVIFANSPSESVRQWTSAYDSTLTLVPKGGGFVELLTAPAGMAFTPLGTYGPGGFLPSFSTLAAFLTANPGWAAIATTGIGPVAGMFSGGAVTLQSSIAGGANAEYVIIGWTGSSVTYDEAFATYAFIGTSSMLTTTTGNPSLTPPGSPTPLSLTFTGIGYPQAIAPIPEPTGFALIGLGALLLTIFRRRN
jgi:hypothetical protein